MRTVTFRFMDLHIWQRAIELSDQLFDIADELEQEKLYRFAEQLRGAVLSISNNISEGSGSDSNKDFAKFLNYSRRSLFEVVNIVIILNRRKKISNSKKDSYILELDELSRMIISFKRSLK
ncbi:MAG: four helix bundle protein [Candidatus Cyclobacteriaceae bacterium M2_1C_046]